MKARVIGRKFFQTRCISWSYRNRGYDARTHKNSIDRVAALVIKTIEDIGIKIDELINKITVRVFIIKILAYSARKNKAKGPPAYSTLKPETNSDSPSVKSNGARLVSAKVETYHIRARGQVGNRSHV